MRVPDQEYFEIAMREFRLIQELSHLHIIKMHDIYYNKMQEKIYMLMEYPGEGFDLR